VKCDIYFVLVKFRHESIRRTLSLLQKDGNSFQGFTKSVIYTYDIVRGFLKGYVCHVLYAMLEIATVCATLQIATVCVMLQITAVCAMLQIATACVTLQIATVCHVTDSYCMPCYI
jgi:hypothetical protein